MGGDSGIEGGGGSGGGVKAERFAAGVAPGEDTGGGGNECKGTFDCEVDWGKVIDAESGIEGGGGSGGGVKAETFVAGDVLLGVGGKADACARGSDVFDREAAKGKVMSSGTECGGGSVGGVKAETFAAGDVLLGVAAGEDTGGGGNVCKGTSDTRPGEEFDGVGKCGGGDGGKGKSDTGGIEVCAFLELLFEGGGKGKSATGGTEVCAFPEPLPNGGVNAFRAWVELAALPDKGPGGDGGGSGNRLSKFAIGNDDAGNVFSTFVEEFSGKGKGGGDGN